MRYRNYILVFWNVMIIMMPTFLSSQVRHLVMDNNTELKQVYTDGNLFLLGRKLDSIISNSTKGDELAVSLFFKAAILEDDGNYDAATTFYSEAAKNFAIQRNAESELVSLLQMSLVQFMAGNIDDCELTLKVVKNKSAIKSHQNILIESLELESLVQAKGGRHLESISTLKKIVPLLEKRPEGFAQQEMLLDQIASNYYSIGAIDSAIHYYQSLVSLQEKNHTSASLNGLSTISDLYLKKGDSENAQITLLQALEIANEQKDTVFLANLNSQLGSFFIGQKQWNAAAPYVDNALDFSKYARNVFLSAQNLKNKGIIEYRRGNQEESQLIFNDAIDYYLDLKNYAEVSEILALMQNFEMQVPQISELIPELVSMISLHQDADDKLGIIKNTLVLAKIYFQDGNIKKAKSLLFNIEGMAKESSNVPAQELINKQLSEIFQYEGNSEKALSYFTAYHGIYDKLRSEDISERINRLNVEFETERREQELRTERLINEGQKEVIKRKSLQNLVLIIGVIFSLLIAGGIYLLFLKNKQLEKHKYKALQIENESAMLKSVLKGEESERTRIARELHDGLGTLLATVKMQINGIQNTFPSVTKLKTYLTAEALLDEACSSVREISHDLMPSVIQMEGLDSAVEKLCSAINAKDKIEVEYIGYQVESLVDKDLQINAYRIVQELLKNILKHADATEVIVQITNEEGILEIIVEDNGRGFDLQKQHDGIGLENIKFRIENLKGKLEINSKLAEGSTFEIKLPLSSQLIKK